MDHIKDLVVHVSWKESAAASTQSAVGIIYRSESRSNINQTAVARNPGLKKLCTLFIIVPTAVEPSKGLKQATITHVRSGTTANAQKASMKKIEGHAHIQIFRCEDVAFAGSLQTNISMGHWVHFNMIAPWHKDYELTYIGFKDATTQVSSRCAHLKPEGTKDGDRLRPLDGVEPPLVVLGAPVLLGDKICGFVTGEAHVPAVGTISSGSKGKQAAKTIKGLQIMLLSEGEIDRIE